MYLYSYPSTHGISGLAAGGVWEQFEVWLKMMIEWTQRYTPRPWWSRFGDALGGGNRAYLEMHMEAMLVRTWRPWSSQLGDMHFKAMIVLPWRPWSSEFGDALRGRDWVRLDKWWESVDGRRAGSWHPIHQLVDSQPWECDNVTYLGALMESWLMSVDHVGRYAGSCSHIQGSTRNHENEGKLNNHRWMLYSV